MKQAIDPVLLGALLEQMKQLTMVLNNQQSFASKWLPSIVGLTSVVVAFVVGIFSFLSAKEQIKTARLTSEAQIKSSEEIAKSQLANAKEITISQIKANLVAASRKEWIETLRKNITDLFSLANKMHGEIRRGHTHKSTDYDEMWRLSVYIELMLNKAEIEHENFLAKQIAFLSFCTKGDLDVPKWVELKNDYLFAARNILKSEWVKVKNFS